MRTVAITMLILAVCAADAPAIGLGLFTDALGTDCRLTDASPQTVTIYIGLLAPGTSGMQFQLERYGGANASIVWSGDVLPDSADGGKNLGKGEGVVKKVRAIVEIRYDAVPRIASPNVKNGDNSPWR